MPSQHDVPGSDSNLHLSEQRLRIAEQAAGFGVFEVDLASRRWKVSRQVCELFGLPDGSPDFEQLKTAIFFDDLPKIDAAVEAARDGGRCHVEFRVRHPDGRIRWLGCHGQVFDEASERRLRGAIFDITDRKLLDARLLQLNETLEARVLDLRAETRALEILNETGTVVAAELDLPRLVQAVTDAGVTLSGAEFGAFFYNVLQEDGEAYTLYTLSGAPREAFEKFPMPRNTAIFEPTFRGEGVVRSHDILQDPRYGKSAPYHGMPAGHLPVRSYLAAPVVSRAGEVLGGLFFGHAQPGIFTDRSERLISALAAQAAVAIDNNRLHQLAQHELGARQTAEAELRQLNETLERRVSERTADLAASGAQLEDAERGLRLLIESVSDYAIYMLDPSGKVMNWNPGAQRIKGYDRSEIVGQHFSRFYTDEDRHEGVPSTALKTAAETGKYEAEGWRVRKDGSRFWASVVINAIHEADGTLAGFAKITRDLSERRAAEERLRQAQKMEAVGQLTGGVAHDFNNLLTIIIGNLEMLDRHLAQPDPDPTRLRHSTAHAMQGARRAEALTQRLLAFSRQQPLEPKPVDLGRLVSGMSDLLRRSLGEQISIETVFAAGLWNAHADPNQLEVAILNLAVNARDAMPNGGKLTLETANVHVDEAYAATQAEVAPGSYVMIAVTDNGTGMTEGTISRAFDPFFTTKDIGQGTGLGLSQVYGFVKQSGGHVKIYSEIGEGTTVKVYLPRFHSEVPAEAAEFRPPPVRGARNETILVVEDDAGVRAYTTEILRELGYSVLEAATGRAALEMLPAHPEVQLLFTDVGLPGGMNGRQLADAARGQRRDLKVLFTSGYARNAIVHDGRLDPGVELITKPFAQAALAARLRTILDARASPARVLVVEDEIMIQMLAKEYLEEAGFKVDLAGSATEALNKLRLVGGRVDAVIVDIGLPDRSGDVLLREIRTLYPSMPIVLATGYGNAVKPVEANSSFLQKPYTKEGLIGALRSVGVP